MRTPYLRPVAALLSGLCLGGAGLAMMSAYYVEAVIGTTGEPDRSPLFWYLPVLMLGLMLLAAGLIMSVWGILRLQRLRRQAATDRDDASRG